VGIPGAFTGTCYGTHIPDFVKHVDAIKAKVRCRARHSLRVSLTKLALPQGVDDVFVLGVNDFYVMKEFAAALGATDKVSAMVCGHLCVFGSHTSNCAYTRAPGKHHKSLTGGCAPRYRISCH
jgi:peroxiredoxin